MSLRILFVEQVRKCCLSCCEMIKIQKFRNAIEAGVHKLRTLMQ